MQDAQIIGGENEVELALTPQQQADDIIVRQNEFNVKLDALCKEYKFAITVIKKELPNGFVYEPQLMDTKFMPKGAQVIQAGPEVKVEEAKAEEVKVEEVAAPAEEKAVEETVATEAVAEEAKAEEVIA